MENLEIAGVASLDEVQERLSEIADDDPFRLMVESVDSVAFFLLGLDGTILSWNPGATIIEGYEAEEVLGRHFSLFYTAEAVEHGVPESELALAREVGRCDVDGWRMRRDRSRMLANVSIAALRGRSGRLIGYSNVTRDTTEARAAQEGLREANARMHALMDSIADGVLQLSHEWRILYGNRRAKELITDFEVGGPFWESFPSIIGTPVADSLIRCMNERVMVVYENHFAPTNLWFRARAYPTEEGIGLFFTDITTEKTMQNKLALEQILREKRIEALSQMAGGLAHEINNPLAIIHALASDLEVAATGKEEVAAREVLLACRGIVKTSDRATRVLRALQGFAREAGTDPMLPAALDELLHQCIALLEGRFQRGDIDFCLDVEPALPLVACRETQIRQIVTNLLNNALDAIEEAKSSERWISLTAKRVEDVLWIEVMDGGPGIEEQFRSHLMDPFFTAKVRGLGMGVGLSLSKTIAQEHGGTLTLVDEAEATCFRLTLPLAKAES